MTLESQVEDVLGIDGPLTAASIALRLDRYRNDVRWILFVRPQFVRYAETNEWRVK